MLVGRESEQRRLDQLLADARSGRSGALVVVGEAGIGKTALLDSVFAQAKDLRVVRGVGVETEAELPFGGLYLLLRPYIDRIDALPAPQAAALRAAFGLADAPVGNPFLTGAATLTLLADLAAETPLLCLVDDAQWLDQASLDALLFAARRLHADPIAMLFAARQASTGQPLQVLVRGLEVLRLAGLPRAAAAALLDGHAPRLTTPVRERILEEAGGNALALIELASAVSAAERSAASDGPDAADAADAAELAQQVGPLPVTERVQEVFRSQIAELPEATCLLLATAAADSAARADLVLSVAGSLGVAASDLAAAERANLVTLADGRVAFRHPLVRAAAYQSVPHHQRMAIHRAFAQALGAVKDADRRAWHLAAATTTPDEQVAVELEQAARRAQRRGGAMAVCAAYERAARLSTGADAAARRLVQAARGAYDAGRPDRAARLAAEAVSLTGEPATVAEAIFLEAQVAYERNSPATDATLALQAASLLLQRDPERAMLMLAEAMAAARDACAHDLVRRGVRQLQALALPPGSDLSPLVEGQIGWGHLFDGRADLAVPPMRALVQAVRDRPTGSYLDRVIAAFSGLMIADDEAATALMESVLAQAGAEGALTWIAYALELQALGRLLRGEFYEAEACVAEGVALAVDLGMDVEVVALNAIGAWLAAVGGDEPRCRSLAEEPLAHSARHPTNAALAAWGLGLLDLAAGRAQAALDRLDGVCNGPARHDVLIRAVPDLVEAAVRSGQPDRARQPLAALEHWATHTASSLATALTLRCHALTSPSDAADELYNAALRVYQTEQAPYDEARTRLAYGEWLRRHRRRSDARTQLTEAMAALDRLGAAGWAGRARAELHVLGDRPAAKVHDTDVLKRLTHQELQVVRLAAAGASNREIAARLFLSPRTVGHHLYKAYPKLGVTKRAELTRLVSDARQAGI